ncbi:MAG TPA: NAD(P)-dependent oxidoreductase, partial [Alkalispirochaeta sp.]|nr:NAD(P)-dependent oxidoreductase [Alkalispirochaeta sp.]
MSDFADRPVGRPVGAASPSGLVLFYYHLAREFPQEVDRLREIFPEVNFAVAETEEQFQELLPRAEVIVAPPQPATVLDTTLLATRGKDGAHGAADARGEAADPSGGPSAGASRLRAHVIPFAGINQVPLNWYRQHQVLLAGSHGNAGAVAERAVALMYAAAGRVAEFDADLRQGRWHRRRDEVQPFDYWRSLTGSRITVLGTGTIGCRVAELVAPLVHSAGGERSGELVGLHRGGPNSGHGSAEVHSSHVVTAEAATADGRIRRHPEQLFDRLTTGVEEALAAADVVFVTLPLTEATRGMLTQDLLAATTRATLVNVARAEIIPEEDCYRALTEGTLGAAGIDVWYRNPHPFWKEGPDALPSQYPFHQLRNVVMSPHAASHSREGKLAQFTGALSHVEE